MAHIIEITSSATGIIHENIDLFQYSINGIDSQINQLEESLKVKTEKVMNIKKSSLDLGKDLISSYNEVNKTKNTFINSITKTEEIIDKYYIDQNKIQEYESGLGIKISENEYNLLKENQSNQLSEMNTSIKLSKKYEDFHKGSISACFKNQKKFRKDCFSYTDEIKSNICNLSNEIKNVVGTFLLAYKNLHKQPLSSVDLFLTKFNSLDEIKEMENNITSFFKNDNKLKCISPTKYHIKCFSYLKNANYLKNEDNNNEDNEDSKDNINNKQLNTSSKRKVVEILEDGFENLKYICDEALIKTIKTLFDNFKFIEKEDFDIKKEEEKNKAQKYILKIITNMNNYPLAKDGFYVDKIELPEKYVIEYDRKELKNEELLDLIELLNTHDNRIIFLNRLNDYRGKGKFALCNKDFILLSQLFNIISDKIKKDSDYHVAEMIIVLSETYFVVEGKRKKYLQESFKGNELFKDKNFWEEFLCFSINKEIMKTLKRDQKLKEDKEIQDYKYSNVVFSQILTLIDNMFEFDLEPETIKEILNPKISYYKLNNEFKETINDVIEVKKKQKIEENSQK